MQIPRVEREREKYKHWANKNPEPSLEEKVLIIQGVWGGVVEECVDNPHAVSKAQLDISLRKFCDRKTSYICQY